MCGTNTTVIAVQHSIVLGICWPTNVLMNFHLSRWLLSKDFIAIDEQPWAGKQELKCWIRCCIIVTIVKVIVTYIRIYSLQMEIITLLVRDPCVTLEMLSQWVSNYLRSIQKLGIRHSLDLRLWSWSICSWHTLFPSTRPSFPEFQVVNIC